MSILINTKEYLSVVESVKQEIALAQQRAIIGANREMIALYWNIGKVINDKKSWGSKFIKNLAQDIRGYFPNLRGFSERNLQYMAQFADIYDNPQITQQLLRNLSWKHHVIIMDKVKDEDKRKWYLQSAVESGWSSNILTMQIESNLYERKAVANKTTNFKERLPAPHSDLAEQTLKDPYIFDFINYRDGMVEREIEAELVNNITKLLLELGTGFAFVGNQYHLEIEKEDFYIDLLFYNLKLRSYVVIELKNGDFKPEYAGKLNFYISAVDDLLKTAHDNPTIGILLCKNKKGMIAEYALRNMSAPIGVSEFKMTDVLPKELENILPSAQDIESRINFDKLTSEGV